MKIEHSFQFQPTLTVTVNSIVDIMSKMVSVTFTDLILMTGAVLWTLYARKIKHYQNL